MAKKYTLLIAVFSLIVIGLLPVIAMFVKSFIVNGEPSLENYRAMLQSPRLLRLLANSLALAGATSTITILLGVPLGTVLARTDIPLKRLIATIFIIPLVIPPYIIALAWFYILGRLESLCFLF